MPTDAVGDSMQSQPAFSAGPAQAASSDDCSAVKLKNPDPAQDGATSMSQLHAAVVQTSAQQAVTSSSVQQQLIRLHEAAAPSTNRHRRKRKQPPSEQEQHDAVPSTSTPDNADVAGDPAASAEQGDLRPALSPHKGKQKTSQASGGPAEAKLKTKRKAAPPASGRRGKNVKCKYKDVVGCTIDVPAPIFGVDIPDLYYRGTVLKKDPAHAGSHDMEVSSGVHQAVHQGVPNAHLPSRFSIEAPAATTEQETSSLQTLAAAADSGDI